MGFTIASVTGARKGFTYATEIICSISSMKSVHVLHTGSRPARTARGNEGGAEMWRVPWFQSPAAAGHMQMCIQERARQAAPGPVGSLDRRTSPDPEPRPQAVWPCSGPSLVLALDMS